VSLKPPANYHEVNDRAKKYREYLTPIKPRRATGRETGTGEEV